jgi:Nucleotidyl transferase AbiEii toxin, Type IV TA system
VTDSPHLLSAIGSRLSAIGARWALVGGLAVSVRTAPRFTQDIDIAVSVVSDADAEELVADLANRGFRIASMVEQSSTGRLAIASVVPSSRDDDTLVDLMFAMSGIEPEVVAAAGPLEVLPDVVAPVAVIGHLIALKVLAQDDETRPQDRVDLQSLLTIATAADLSIAAEALLLVDARGFARGKDLLADLATLRQRFRPSE